MNYQENTIKFLDNDKKLSADNAKPDIVAFSFSDIIESESRRILENQFKNFGYDFLNDTPLNSSQSEVVWEMNRGKQIGKRRMTEDVIKPKKFDYLHNSDLNHSDNSSDESNYKNKSKDKNSSISTDSSNNLNSLNFKKNPSDKKILTDLLNRYNKNKSIRKITEDY